MIQEKWMMQFRNLEVHLMWMFLLRVHSSSARVRKSRADLLSLMTLDTTSHLLPRTRLRWTPLFSEFRYRFRENIIKELLPWPMMKENPVIMRTLMDLHEKEGMVPFKLDMINDNSERT